MKTLHSLTLAALFAASVAPVTLSAQTPPAQTPSAQTPPAQGTATPPPAGAASDAPSADQAAATPAADQVPGRPHDGVAGPYLAARAAAMENDYVEASRWYGEALDFDLDDQMLVDSYLMSVLSAGQMDKAVDYSRKIVGTDAVTPLSRIVVRSDLARQGKWDELLADIDKSTGGRVPGAPGQDAADQTADQPDGSDPAAGEGQDGGGDLLDGMIRSWALMGAGRATEAMASFEELRKVPGADAMAQYHLGLARASVGDYEGAEKSMAAPGVSSHLLGLIAQSEVLSQLDRNTDAIKLMDGLSGIENEPMLVDMRRRLEAGETLPFDQIRSPADGIAQVFLTFAGALATGEDPDPLALIHARLGSMIAPDLGEARLMSAQLLQSVGQFDLAEKEFQALADIGEVRPVAELARIEALAQADRMADAESAARALTDAQPDLPSAWTALGDLLRQQDKWTDAIGAYDRAITLLQKGPDKQALWFPLYARGIALERSGQFDKSDADMRAALELQPDHASILNYLGYSWVDRNVNLDEALRLIERAVELRPDDGYILDSLAWAHYRLGRYDEAVAPMERAVSAMSNDSLVNDHMGDIYWKAGRTREASVQWRRALSLWKDADTDTDPDRIRAKIEVGLDKVLEAEAANGGKLPAGFGLPKDPPKDDAATDDAGAGATPDAGTDGEQVDDTPPPEGAPDTGSPLAPAPNGDAPVPPSP